jgi:hypothetical protein
MEMLPGHYENLLTENFTDLKRFFKISHSFLAACNYFTAVALNALQYTRSVQ